jgi:hypothetical protein
MLHRAYACQGIYGRGARQQFQSACGDAPSDASLAGAIQNSGRSSLSPTVYSTQFQLRKLFKFSRAKCINSLFGEFANSILLAEGPLLTFFASDYGY